MVAVQGCLCFLVIMTHRWHALGDRFTGPGICRPFDLKNLPVLRTVRNKSLVDKLSNLRYFVPESEQTRTKLYLKNQKGTGVMKNLD